MTTKTKIEWLRNPATGEQGFSVNPVKGLCPVGCSYCYARPLYHRFKWNPEIRYDPSVFFSPPKKPSRIFVGSTMELFGEWVRQDWLDDIMANCELWSEHTFIFLTKLPENLPKWSPFPDNCWVGVTATNKDMFERGIYHLRQIKASVKFMSFEPLLGGIASIDVGIRELNLVIIGACTGTLPEMVSLCDKYPELVVMRCGNRVTAQPRIEWLREIVEAADKVGCKVFLKDNLKPLIFQDAISGQVALDWGLLTWAGDLRQEFPKVKEGK